MRLLIDTNIILEIMLDRPKSEDAKNLLANNIKHDLFISDYTFHSIRTILFNKNLHNTFREFVDDLINKSGILILSISSEETNLIIEYSKKFNLDFDNAYQYSIATKYELEIISFDKDFDRTSKGKLTPGEISRN